MCLNYFRLFILYFFDFLLFPTSLCGVLVFDSVARVPPPTSSHLLLPPPVTHHLSHHLSHTTLSHTTLSHTIFHTQLCHTPSFTHNFVTRHLSHTTLSHTIFHTTLSTTIFPIQLCHTPSFTYNFVTHHFSHITLSHAIFHTQLCHTPSFTHNFVTHHLSNTTLSHTIFHIQLCQPPSFPYNFVTHRLSHPPLSHTIFPKHLCHTPSFTPTFVTHHGRRGTNSHPPSSGVAAMALMALGGALGLCLVARDAAALCVAGAAHTHIYRRFAWQAWHRLTSIIVLRGRRGTDSHLPSFCVAAMALLALGGALGLGLVFRDAAALCVASAAQTHIYRRFAWQAWHKLTSTIVLPGRRGTDGTGWRAWSWFSRPWRRDTLRGRRGTNSHLPSFSVAGVAQTHMYHRFAWQAWHRWPWAARLVLV